MYDIAKAKSGIRKQWLKCSNDRVETETKGEKKNAEIQMCWSGLYVREPEASQYLVPWYWNVQMCGSGLYVREPEASQYLVLWYWIVQMCGSGLYVLEPEVFQYLVLLYWKKGLPTSKTSIKWNSHKMEKFRSHIFPVVCISHSIAFVILSSVSEYISCKKEYFSIADTSLARPGKKSANVSVRMA